MLGLNGDSETESKRVENEMLEHFSKMWEFVVVCVAKGEKNNDKNHTIVVMMAKKRFCLRKLFVSGFVWLLDKCFNALINVITDNVINQHLFTKIH